MKSICKVLFLMLLVTGFALAQTSPSTSTPDQSQAPSASPDASQAPSSSQTPSSTPDQSQTPPAAGSQSQYPSSTGQAAGATTSSSDVKTAIQTAFQQDSSLMNSGINVSVSDSKVTLSGSASSADKEKANKIAQANAGGRTVVDKITTNDSTGAAPKQ